MKRLALAAVLLAVLCIAVAFAQVQAPPATDDIVLVGAFGINVPADKEPLAKAEWQKLADFLREQNLATIGPWTIPDPERVNKMKAKGETVLQTCNSTISITGTDAARIGLAIVAIDDALRAIKVQCGGDGVAKFKIYYHQSCRVAERSTKALK